MAKKTIVVIGASGTIGSAVSKKLDAQGHRLGLHFVSNSEAIDTLLKTCCRSSEHRTYSSPLDSLKSVEDTIDRFQKLLGGIDGLALCGGRIPNKNQNELTPIDWTRAFFELSVVPFHLALYFSKQCAPKSRIVSLSSIAVAYGGSSESRHYAAAKAALENSLTALARDLQPQEICINMVRSGFVDSPSQRNNRSANQIRSRIEKIPFNRPADPAEIAQAFSFLFDSDSTFITGQKITVAGGE